MQITRFWRSAMAGEDQDPPPCRVVGWLRHPAGEGAGDGGGAAGDAQPFVDVFANGANSGQGSEPLRTWIYATYTAPGTFNPQRFPYAGDIDTLTHEIAEWADDPFVTNTVSPWSSPAAPQYGCSSLLEVGDPVVPVSFAEPGNTDATGPYADGYWHLQDEVFLPWFERQAPNTTSQPTQQPSPDGGRYTFMGDLNPYAAFHQPAAGC